MCVCVCVCACVCVEVCVCVCVCVCVSSRSQGNSFLSPHVSLPATMAELERDYIVAEVWAPLGASLEHH